jgi:hypothetical protein
MKRNHPVHGLKTLCNACGVRLSRRTKADKHRGGDKSSLSGSLSGRCADSEILTSSDDCPRTRTERKRSARALDALGLTSDHIPATTHKRQAVAGGSAKSGVDTSLCVPEPHVGSCACVVARAICTLRTRSTVYSARAHEKALFVPKAPEYANT